jgi:hypothetical protein
VNISAVVNSTEHGETRSGLAQDRDAAHCGAQGEADQRTAPVPARDIRRQLARLVPAGRTQRHALRGGHEFWRLRGFWADVDEKVAERGHITGEEHSSGS